MNALLDLIVVAVFIIIVIVSAKRGLVKSVLGLVAVIVSFIVAQSFCAPLSAYLEEKYFAPMFADTAAAQLGSVTNDTGTSEEILQGNGFAKLFEDAPQALDNILASWGTDLETISEKLASAGDAAEKAVNKFIVETVVGGAAKAISAAVAFILLFLASLIVCLIIVAILDAASKLPVLKTLNGLGGALFGIVKGGIVVIVIAAIISFASPYISINDERLITEDAVNATIVFKYLTPESIFSEHSPSDIYNAIFKLESGNNDTTPTPTSSPTTAP